MLKRIFSVFILTIFLAHFAGFYIYFFVQLNQVRKEMRIKLKELPSDELELLTLSPEEYQKAKVEEHEVRVDGKMYDIARVEKREGKILVYCLHDAAEDNLLAFLDKILSLPLKDKHVPTGVLQFYSLHYLSIYWNFVIPEFAPTQSFTAYTEMSSQYISVIVTPPPKV